VVFEVNGRAIRQARVEFVNSSTGWAVSALTDDHGNFVIAGLPATSYRVIVTAPNCERFESALTVDETAGPLLWRLRKLGQPATPRNDLVVSAQELRMSGKAASAFAKGAKLLEKAEVKRSLPYFERAIAIEPGYYQAYHDLGLAHYQLGESARAEEDFQKSIDLSNGGYAPSQFALAMILSEKQQFRDAERLLQNGLAMEPGSAVGKYFLSVVQFAQNRPTEAEKSARDALWRNAGQADAYILLAKIHEREHDPYAVEADVAAYFKLDPDGRLKIEGNRLLQSAKLRINQAVAANQ
jgi:tetratricopeptide (TPR) repeat protein